MRRNMVYFLADAPSMAVFPHSSEYTWMDAKMLITFMFMHMGRMDEVDGQPQPPAPRTTNPYANPYAHLAGGVEADSGLDELVGERAVDAAGHHAQGRVHALRLKVLRQVRRPCLCVCVVCLGTPGVWVMSDGEIKI